jgi:hypothetical protein
MSDWLIKVIRAEARRLLELAADDAELRADLRALAEEILVATQAPPSGVEAGVETQPAPPGPSAPLQEKVEPLRELTLGRSFPSSSESPGRTASRSRSMPPGDDLAALETHCRSKAEAARWAAECQRRIREGTELRDDKTLLDRDVRAWAEKLTDGFYWLGASTASAGSDISVLDQAAGCFEALAESLALARARVREGRSKAFERALQLLAEAQSALRRALRNVNLAGDPDQEGVYEWVRAAAARYRIYLRRYLRADDLADPADWPSLLARIEEERSSGRRTPLQVAQLERMSHHQASIREGKGTEADWSAIIEAVDALIGAEFPPSSPEIRERLLPIIDEIPDRHDLPRSFRLVLREIDRFLATRSLPSATRSEVAHEPAVEVKEAAALLRGKSVVLIGGSRRRETQESLRRAFGLESLFWIETKEHQSVETFEPVIARPEVALVLLAIRWSSHGFGDVRQFCERHRKPLVRLPGGYSPNQVAAQILLQCSEQLRGPDSESEGA